MDEGLLNPDDDDFSAIIPYFIWMMAYFTRMMVISQQLFLTSHGGWLTSHGGWRFLSNYSLLHMDDGLLHLDDGNFSAIIPYFIWMKVSFYFKKKINRAINTISFHYSPHGIIIVDFYEIKLQ